MKKTFAKVLKLMRVVSNINQRDFSKIIGYYPSCISFLENGKRSANIESLSRYSKHFDVPISSIVLAVEMIDKMQDPCPLDLIQVIGNLLNKELKVG